MLVVDNGSVFTKNLTDYMSCLGVAFEARAVADYTPDCLRHDAFILSGRQRNAKKTNQINSAVIRYAVKNSAKLLGICYGAEILALTAGGTIKKSPACRGPETVKIHKACPVAQGTIDVFESHTFEIAKLPDTMTLLGSSQSCRHELFQYADLPIYGTQFHPEMSDDGQELIAKFCDL